MHGVLLQQKHNALTRRSHGLPIVDTSLVFYYLPGFYLPLFICSASTRPFKRHIIRAGYLVVYSELPLFFPIFAKSFNSTNLNSISHRHPSGQFVLSLHPAFQSLHVSVLHVMSFIPHHCLSTAHIFWIALLFTCLKIFYVYVFFPTHIRGFICLLPYSFVDLYVFSTSNRRCIAFLTSTNLLCICLHGLLQIDDLHVLMDCHHSSMYISTQTAIHRLCAHNGRRANRHWIPHRPFIFLLQWCLFSTYMSS